MRTRADAPRITKHGSVPGASARVRLTHPTAYSYARPQVVSSCNEPKGDCADESVASMVRVRRSCLDGRSAIHPPRTGAAGEKSGGQAGGKMAYRSNACR